MPTHTSSLDVRGSLPAVVTCGVGFSICLRFGESFSAEKVKVLEVQNNI